MQILDLLKGKKMKVETDMGVKVELIIKEVKEEHHSEDLEPATPENDWWPNSRDWTTFQVFFTNGRSKTYSSLSEIKIEDENN
jgi:hypothetical protein